MASPGETLANSLQVSNSTQDAKLPLNGVYIYLKSDERSPSASFKSKRVPNQYFMRRKVKADILFSPDCPCTLPVQHLWHPSVVSDSLHPDPHPTG